jgi:hypothetical protein
MRNKTLLLSTLALGLAALLALRLTREEAPAAAESRPLVPAALLADLRALTVKSGPRTVTVERSADGWTVKDRFGLPADAENRLLPLVRGLQKAREFGVLTANPKRLEKLGLTETSVTLVGADGKATTIEFGRQTEDGLGHSARLAGQPHALRTDFTAFLEADPTAWVDLTLFTAKPAEVRTIALAWKDGRTELSRKASGAPFDGADAAALEELVATLATLRAADAVAKNDADAAKAARTVEAKLTTFDGATATMAFAKLAGAQPGDPGKLFVRVTHSDPKHPANAADKLAVFTVPSWLVEQLPASFADFKKSGQPAAPAAPSLLPIPGPAQNAPASPLVPAK